MSASGPSSGLKKQRAYYSGKRRGHTLKAQLVIDLRSERFMCVAVGPGRQHDFSLFRASRVRLHRSLLCLADKGYQGIQQLHANSHTPCKGAARAALCAAERKAERALAAVRVRIEHAIGRLKCFRILSERYRNRRRRFGLRLHLIAGIVNYELALKAP